MRIISLAPSNTEIIFALGSGKELVGVTRFCDYPKEAKSIEKIGGWLDINFDKILELKPDLVISSNFLQKEFVSRLEREGINIVHVDPRTLNDVFESIIFIGRKIGKIHEAKQVVNNMKKEIKTIKKLVRDLNKKRVYVEEWHRPPTVSGNWVPDIVNTAGGISLINSGEISRKVSLEELEEFDPDFMVISWCGFGTLNMKKFVFSRGWNKLRVVKNNLIHIINDSYLNRPSPRLVKGLKELVNIIHPELKIEKYLY